MTVYRSPSCPSCAIEPLTCLVHMERPLSEASVQKFAERGNGLDVFEAVARGDYTAEDGSRILMEMRERATPPWLRVLRQIWWFLEV